VHCLFGPIGFIRSIHKIFCKMHLEFVHCIHWIVHFDHIQVVFCALEYMGKVILCDFNRSYVIKVG